MSPQPVLFVQGAGDMWAPDGSGVLARYLTDALGPEYEVIAPEMPDADTNPRYIPWRDRINAELLAFDGDAVIVGHSFGGSVVLKCLAAGRSPRAIVGLFLVSVPFWGPGGWSYDEYDLPDDFGSKLPRVPTFFYQGREDPDVPFSHLTLFRQRLPSATFRPVDGAEHSFVNGLPELVDDIRSTSDAAASLTSRVSGDG